MEINQNSLFPSEDNHVCVVKLKNAHGELKPDDGNTYRKGRRHSESHGISTKRAQRSDESTL